MDIGAVLFSVFCYFLLLVHDENKLPTNDDFFFFNLGYCYCTYGCYECCSFV